MAAMAVFLNRNSHNRPIPYMKKILLPILTVVFCAFLFSACNDDDEKTGTSYLAIHLTDTVAPYDSVIIDVQGVEVKTNGSTVLLNVNPGHYNLLDFTNGKDTLIAFATIPSGKVSQIRLLLGSDNYIIVDGVRHDLATPSAQQSGLKLNVHYDLVGGVDYILLLDFDAGRSIVTTGNGGYSLKPVIRVVTLAASGSITGAVQPSAALPALATAMNATDTMSAFTDSNGHFLIHGVPAGTYTVVVEPQLPYGPDTVYNVGVTVGQLTDIGILNF